PAQCRHNEAVAPRRKGARPARCAYWPPGALRRNGVHERRRAATPTSSLALAWPPPVGVRSDGAPRRGNRGRPHREYRGCSVLVVRGVLLDIVLPLGRHVALGINSADRADRLAGAAVDARVRVDVQHRLVVETRLARVRVDAVDRAGLDAGLVLRTDAGLADHVGHRSPSTPHSLRLPSHPGSQLAVSTGVAWRKGRVNVIARQEKRAAETSTSVSLSEERPGGHWAARLRVLGSGATAAVWGL